MWLSEKERTARTPDRAHENVNARTEKGFSSPAYTTSIDQTPHYSQQLNRINRLGDMVLVADREGAQTVFLTPISRQRDGRNMPAALALPRAQFLHQRITVFPRHADVGDEYVRPPFVTGGQRLRRTDCGPHLRAALREHHGYKFTRIGFVIHKQRAHALERRRIIGRRYLTRRIVARLDRRHGAGPCDRQRDREGRAFAKPLARDARRPAVQFDYMAHDGESQSQSTLLAVRPTVRLPEALENVWQKLRLDPLPVVGD